MSRYRRLLEAERAAEPPAVAPDAGPFRQLRAELRWCFTPPWTWLTGIGVNLALALLWLLWVPLTGRSHGGWVVLVGTYFAVFILADVTTTNMLGADARRVRLQLAAGVGVWRLLLVKNLALFTIVGLPTLVLTAVLTLASANTYRLIQTLPGVALPVLAWLGVGNVVSVLLPVTVKSLRQRWAERRQIASTTRWLAHLALPYALLYAVDPLSDLPRVVLHSLARQARTPEYKAVLLTVSGLTIWLLGTLCATVVARRRGLRLA